MCCFPSKNIKIAVTEQSVFANFSLSTSPSTVVYSDSVLLRTEGVSEWVRRKGLWGLLSAAGEVGNGRPWSHSCHDSRGPLRTARSEADHGVAVFVAREDGELKCRLLCHSERRQSRSFMTFGAVERF